MHKVTPMSESMSFQRILLTGFTRTDPSIQRPHRDWPVSCTQPASHSRSVSGRLQQQQSHRRSRVITFTCLVQLPQFDWLASREERRHRRVACLFVTLSATLDRLSLKLLCPIAPNTYYFKRIVLNRILWWQFAVLFLLQGNQHVLNQILWWQPGVFFSEWESGILQSFLSIYEMTNS